MDIQEQDEFRAWREVLNLMVKVGMPTEVNGHQTSCRCDWCKVLTAVKEWHARRMILVQR